MGPCTVDGSRDAQGRGGELAAGGRPGTKDAKQHSQARWSPTPSRPNHRRLQTSAEVHWGQNHTQVTALLWETTRRFLDSSGLRLVVRPGSWASGRTAQGLHASRSAVGLPSTVGANMEPVQPHSFLPEPERPLFRPVLGKQAKLPQDKDLGPNGFQRTRGSNAFFLQLSNIPLCIRTAPLSVHRVTGVQPVSVPRLL